MEYSVELQRSTIGNWFCYNIRVDDLLFEVLFSNKEYSKVMNHLNNVLNDKDDAYLPGVTIRKNGIIEDHENKVWLKKNEMVSLIKAMLQQKEKYRLVKTKLEYYEIQYCDEPLSTIKFYCSEQELYQFKNWDGEKTFQFKDGSWFSNVGDGHFRYFIHNEGDFTKYSKKELAYIQWLISKMFVNESLKTLISKGKDD